MKKRYLALVAIVALAAALTLAVGSAKAWTPTNLVLSCGEADAALPQAATYSWSITDETGATLSSGSHAFSSVLNFTEGWYETDNGYHTVTLRVWYGNESGSTLKAIVHDCSKPVGPQGPKGDKGDKGDTGATGAKGDKGDTGATGAKGDKGDTGATGAKGDTGATGAKGDKGDTGARGARGKQGKPGKCSCSCKKKRLAFTP